MRKIFLPTTLLSFIALAAFAAPQSHAVSVHHIKLAKGLEAKVSKTGHQGRIRFFVEHDLWSKGPKAQFNLTVRRYHKSVWGPYDKVTSPLAAYTTSHAHTCNRARAGYDCSIYRYYFGDVRAGDYVSGNVRFCYSQMWPFKNYCKNYKVFSFFR